MPPVGAWRRGERRTRWWDRTRTDAVLARRGALARATQRSQCCALLLWASAGGRSSTYLSLIAQSAATRGFRVRVAAICPGAGGVSSAPYRSAQKLLLAEDPREHLSLAEVLADGDVDVVDVDLPPSSSSSSLLSPDWLAAARTGKHGKAVITSSTLSPSIIAQPTSTMRPCVTLLQQEGAAPWAVLEPWAYKPGVRKVVELLQAGAVGDAGTYVWDVCKKVSIRDGSWEKNGACIVHLLRAVRHLFGEITSASSSATTSENSVTTVVELSHEPCHGNPAPEFGPHDNHIRRQCGQMS